MRILAILSLGVLVALAGCSVKREGMSKAAASASAASAGENALLEPLLLKEKPSDAKSVGEVKASAQAGDEVVLVGTVPPECVVPFNDSRAVVILMDAKDLANEAVINEFACPEAATCPACRKVLDTLGVQVELVGAAGKLPIKTTLQGFKGLKPGSTITVKGKLEKDGKTMVVRATGFYVG
jgi:hypothetical protein